MLAQKKKIEYQMVEGKIKEIVESFKGKMEVLDREI